MPTSTTPVFVVGSPRSGTTMLTRLLSAHPDLFVANEMDVLGFLDSMRSGMDNLLKPFFQFDVPDATIPLCAGQLDRLLIDLIRSGGKVRWGSKFPHYSLYMNKLEAYYPDCQFVHIYRDGRDVACSMLRMKRSSPSWRDADWAPATHGDAAKMWSKYVTAAREHGCTLPSERYFEVRFEELVTRPQEFVAKLFGYLGYPFVQSVREAATGLTPKRIGEHKMLMDESALDDWHGHGPASALLKELGYEIAEQEQRMLVRPGLTSG